MSTGELSVTASERELKARHWISSARSYLQESADSRETVGYLGSINLAEVDGLDRTFSPGTIEPETERFMTALERAVWNEHFQGRVASLEDSRTDFIDKHGIDIIGEQFTVMRVFLDAPELYQ